MNTLSLQQLINKFSPKAYMSSLLIALALLGSWQQGIHYIYKQLLLAVIISIVLDLIINYVKKKRFVFPSSAFISGMIIAMVLSPNVQWYISIIAAAIAIIQKHILLYPKNKPIFNPAALGLLAVIFLFNANINWWGQSNWLLIIIAGILIAFKSKKIKIAISFIIFNTIIFTFGYYFADKTWINPFLYVNFFFIFVMLIEPKTSPYSQKEQYIYATANAILSFIFFLVSSQYDYSILALIVTNIFMCIMTSIKMQQTKNIVV